MLAKSAVYILLSLQDGQKSKVNNSFTSLE